MSEKNVERVGEQSVYSGRRISLSIVRYRKNGRIYDKEVVRHPGAVVILPIVHGEVILERQYRPAIDEWILELPAGTLESGETPEACARRELLEETGYFADTLVHLGSFYASPGYSDELLHAFLAENPVYRGRAPEEYEAIEIVRVPLSVFEKWIEEGKVRDAKTLAAYALYLSREKRK